MTNPSPVHNDSYLLQRGWCVVEYDAKSTELYQADKKQEAFLGISKSPASITSLGKHARDARKKMSSLF
jgi:hypothetical protein